MRTVSLLIEPRKPEIAKVEQRRGCLYGEQRRLWNVKTLREFDEVCCSVSDAVEEYDEVQILLAR